MGFASVLGDKGQGLLLGTTSEGWASAPGTSQRGRKGVPSGSAALEPALAPALWATSGARVGEE